MLIEMNLRNLLQPATLLETFELEALCRKYMPLDTDWEVVDGLINVTGPFELKSFVQDGKLIAPFGTVTTMMLNAGSVRSLVGFPKIVHGIVDIRSGWLESLEGCPEQADSIYVQTHHLKSLEHGPKRAPFYGISSESVVSLAGVSKHGIGTLSVSGCNSIKTTDGLDGVTLDALSLPPDIHEITEYPVSCKELTYPICAGFPRLFLAEGLTTMTVGDVNKSKISKAVIAKVDDICKQVLEVTGNKRRYLRAQTLLIDADLEELL